jgi:hypothetical protein
MFVHIFAMMAICELAIYDHYSIFDRHLNYPDKELLKNTDIYCLFHISQTGISVTICSFLLKTKHLILNEVKTDLTCECS